MMVEPSNSVLDIVDRVSKIFSNHDVATVGKVCYCDGNHCTNPNFIAEVTNG